MNLPKDRYVISLLVPGLPCDPLSFEQRSLGGSETAGLSMAHQLAAVGHDVRLFCNTPAPGTSGMLSWAPISHFDTYSRMPHDICIVQRAPEVFSRRINSRVNVLWCHDLGLRRAKEQMHGVLWNVDQILVVSKFMKGQYREAYDIEPRLITVTRNGINPTLFPTPRPPEKRERKRLVYSARPERGLDVLLRKVFPAILEADPDFELAIFGYDNEVDHLRGFYQELAALCSPFGDRIKNGGKLSKRVLYEAYSRAGLYVYPTPGELQPDFAEVSCISLMEAQACGLPVICSDAGALSETLAPGAGVLIPGMPNTDEAVTAFANAVIDYANDDDKYRAAQTAGIERAKEYNWRGVAEDWTRQWPKIIARKNTDPERLARHFWRLGDRVAARAVEGVEPDPTWRGPLPEIESVRTREREVAAEWLTSRGIPIDGLIEPGECRFNESALVALSAFHRSEEPWTAILQAEKAVAKGAHIFLSFPWGGCDPEAMWNFDNQDLKDIFAKKPGLEVQSNVAADSQETGRPLGLHYIAYRADHEPLGVIDIKRKHRIQVPRETVSFSMIAGAGSYAPEDTLHWCLRSVAWHVDEIVVADCGCSEEALRILRQYDARIVPGEDPKVVGFDVPRNTSLDLCAMDWVLWLDADERLTDTRNLEKYLRSNLYDAYGIRQYHFACDGETRIDMPTRLFRRRNRNDKSEMRFVGRIHEHPVVDEQHGPGAAIILCDVHIPHTGYLIESGRRQRFSRNNPLLDLDCEAYPDRRLQKFLIIRDNMLKCMHKIQENGSQITPEIQALAAEARDLYREHFLGKPAVMHGEGLSYYSDALRILGEGIEFSFEIQAERDGVGDKLNGHGVRARFASSEEAEAEIRQVIRDKVAPLTGKWW